MSSIKTNKEKKKKKMVIRVRRFILVSLGKEFCGRRNKIRRKRREFRLF